MSTKASLDIAHTRVGGARDVNDVDIWLAGGCVDVSPEYRFRLLLEVVDILVESDLPESDLPEIVQSWLIGLNPDLGDRVPLRLFARRASGVDLVGSARRASHGGTG